jgi:hypothetical protein
MQQTAGKCCTKTLNNSRRDFVNPDMVEITVVRPHMLRISIVAVCLLTLFLFFDPIGFASIVIRCQQFARDHHDRHPHCPVSIQARHRPRCDRYSTSNLSFHTLVPFAELSF